MRKEFQQRFATECRYAVIKTAETPDSHKKTILFQCYLWKRRNVCC